MYARLDNDSLIFAPSHLIVGNQNVWNAPAEEYISQGWFPVIYTEAPITDDHHYAELSWTQEDDQIVQVWTVVEIPTPSDEDELTDEQIGIVLTGGEL